MVNFAHFPWSSHSSASKRQTFPSLRIVGVVTIDPIRRGTFGKTGKSVPVRTSARSGKLSVMRSAFSSQLSDS